MARSARPQPKKAAQRRASAREAARAAAAERARKNPRDYWHRDAPDLPFGREQFRVLVYRGGRPTLRLDHLVQALSWTDAEDPPMMTGAATLAQPARRGDQRLDVTVGDALVVDVADRPGGRLRRELNMRVSERTHGFQSGTVELTLEDALAYLNRSRDDFHYSKGPGHPRGWLAHEIVRDVARRYRFRVGRLTRGRRRITKLSATGKSPVDVIEQAYNVEERKSTGKKYVVAWQAGRLTVLPHQRSRELLRLGPKLVEATYRQALGEEFATVLRSSEAKDAGSGGRKKSKQQEVRSRNSARYGRVVRRVSAAKGSSTASRRTDLARQLREASEPDRELSLSHPGVLGLRRGHAVQVVLAEEDLRRIVYVKEVTHSVSSGSYDMEVTCGFEDPFVAEAEALRKRRLADVARKRRRVATAGSRTARARPAKAKQRGGT